MKIIKTAGLCLALSLMSCGDLDLGANYRQSFITKKNGNNIYCYEIEWALDAQMTFISTKIVCADLGPDEDICFGKGDIVIYYKIREDTFYIFSNVTPKIPKTFPLVLKVSKLDIQQREDCEREYKSGNLDKVIFDTVFHRLPCNISPDTSEWTMRFINQNTKPR
jgi:hypothetical protein